MKQILPDHDPTFEQPFSRALHEFAALLPEEQRQNLRLDADTSHIMYEESLLLAVEYVLDRHAAVWGATQGYESEHDIDHDKVSFKPRIVLIDMEQPSSRHGWQGIERWSDTGFEQAARLYRRECGWDHSPGRGGTWIVYIQPGTYISNFMRCRLGGFCICHDRNFDGQMDSIAHLWVAEGYRRHGVATKLIHKAEQRFDIENIEGPATDAGEMFLAALGLKADRRRLRLH